MHLPRAPRNIVACLFYAGGSRLSSLVATGISVCLPVHSTSSSLHMSFVYVCLRRMWVTRLLGHPHNPGCSCHLKTLNWPRKPAHYFQFISTAQGSCFQTLGLQRYFLLEKSWNPISCFSFYEFKILRKVLASEVWFELENWKKKNPKHTHARTYTLHLCKFPPYILLTAAVIQHPHTILSYKDWGNNKVSVDILFTQFRRHTHI